MSQSHIGGVSRREFLAKVAAGGAGALMSFAGPVIEKAYGAGPCSGHLTDIEHFVFFMQENRSFDHYFGGHRWIQHGIAALPTKGLEPDDAGS